MSNAHQDWSFGGNWPYKARWFETSDGTLHYIDEGPRDGDPVVMIHGNPTWGYLYRRFVAAVTKAGYRAIVMDHLGFGRSDKPSQATLYQVPRHAERCSELLESLDLHNVTLVVQDWGGAHWACLGCAAPLPRGEAFYPQHLFPEAQRAGATALAAQAVSHPGRR